ncbi:3-hydroxybutyryl-CoA dehydrogenase [Hwanghaeella grinnelliae]|uniref:3-hydroxybutyryl-CoA dehydrogenase n=1 Tax=Hwanghaeella grinnelliae TaxID=2500179 RepID=A0A3S3UR45_9PROT|nr:3-hydroxyacyl-CoA dehydrogenase NAD-binding domain-containing protein [Hwanghaeella grinnelliae]RVU38611.1 3-hydroxybutyryl-CoA dehydrogenase [Hwanghaeella grinnelliae]
MANYPKPESVTRVASLGGGPIGGGWAAHFLARGYEVSAYLHDPAEEPTFRGILETAWISLTELGLAEGASLDRLTVTSDLAKSVDGAQFIQESGPEILPVKRELYRNLGEIVPTDVVIGSSTSGLTMTEIQLDCATPERCVIGHPFNPPYLLPLVEIVGGKKTAADAVAWAGSFYQVAGKAPLIMKKEIPGFVATRLQEALWREALHMVDNDEATPEQIDIALKNGPAPRMVVQGQCMAFHVACGAGGMATNLDQFGPTLKLPWTRLAAPDLTQSLRDKMVDGCNEMADPAGFEKMAEERDRMIVAVLKAVQGGGG